MSPHTLGRARGCAAWVLAAVGVARADLVYLEQERFIALKTGCGGLEAISAPDNAPFHALMHTAFLPWMIRQDSWLLDQRVDFRGEATIEFFYLPHCFLFAESFLRVRFEVSEPQEFRLWGDIESSYAASGDTVELAGPGTSILFDGPGIVRAAGILEPGEYSLKIRLWAVDIAAPDHTLAKIRFSVPSAGPAAVFGLFLIRRRR